MGYWQEIKITVTTKLDQALSSIKEGVGDAVEFAKEEAHLVALKKDLFLKQRELHDTLADLGDKTKDTYNEKGNIYRNDIGEIMHKVTLIEGECIKLQREIDHVHDKVKQ